MAPAICHFYPAYKLADVLDLTLEELNHLVDYSNRCKSEA